MSPLGIVTKTDGGWPLMRAELSIDCHGKIIRLHLATEGKCYELTTEGI